MTQKTIPHSEALFDARFQKFLRAHDPVAALSSREILALEQRILMAARQTRDFSRTPSWVAFFSPTSFPKDMRVGLGWAATFLLTLFLGAATGFTLPHATTLTDTTTAMLWSSSYVTAQLTTGEYDDVKW